MIRSSWRPALRLARREVLRAKGRGALVVAMIGIPVLLVTGLAVLVRTLDAPPEAQALPTLGNADALVRPDGSTPLDQDPAGEVATMKSAGNDEGGRGWTTERVERAIGGRVVPVRTGSTLVETDLGALSAAVRELHIQDPVIGDLARVTDGRMPRDTDEVLVSETLVDRGYRPGTTVRIAADQPRELDVVGVVRNPMALNEPELVGLPGSVLDRRSGSPEYLVDTGGQPVSWSDVRELNQLGLIVVSRSVLLDPPAPSQVPASVVSSGTDANLLLLYALAVTSVVLEIVLLAGPAFAVGARRQARQFALLAATGGTPKDIRRVLLGQGLVLGLGSALAGVLLGILAVVAGQPLLEQLVGRELGQTRVRPLDLALIVVAGTGAAFAAAYVPARQAARRHTVAALAGRPGQVRARKGWPFAGTALLGAGLVLSSYGVINRSGGEWSVVLGTLAIVGAAIIATPALLGLVGRLGTGLPLPLRLAVRDAARHRTRSASAVAAVMGTVIGVTALGIGSSSDFAESRRDYEPQATNETMLVNAGYESSLTRDDAEALTGRIEHVLPGRTASVGYGSDDWGNTAVLVADAATIGGLTGEPLTGAQRRTLDSGGALVFGKAGLASDGQARIGTKGDRVELPATVTPALNLRREAGWTERLANVVVTPETAERIELAAPTMFFVPPGQPAISERQEATVEELVDGMAGGYANVYVERGFVKSYAPILLLLIGTGTLLVLVGTSTATALALADARPDFATLGAVGASPKLRRLLAMAQAGVIGLLGSGLGVVVGAVPGVAVTYPLTGLAGPPVLDVPWTLLGVVVLAVPLVAVAGAGVFTRSRLPMVRRIE